jgi:hypothetical protein
MMFEIHLLGQTRNSCEKCNFKVPDRNRTCGPVIHVLRALRFLPGTLKLHFLLLFLVRSNKYTMSFNSFTWVRSENPDPQSQRWRALDLTTAPPKCWQVVGTALSQLVNKLARSLLRRHLVDKLLEQHCHNLLTSLLQACWGDILLTSCWNSIVTTC